MTGSPPKKAFGNNRRSVPVEEETKEQSERIVEVKEVDNIPCHVKEHPRYNYTKAIIYVHEFDLESIEEFKEGLRAHYNVAEKYSSTIHKDKICPNSITYADFLAEASIV